MSAKEYIIETADDNVDLYATFRSLGVSWSSYWGAFSFFGESNKKLIEELAAEMNVSVVITEMNPEE